MDRASFGISASDRHEVAPAVYQIMIDHAEGHAPVTILDTIRGTFKQALEAIPNTRPDTVGPAFFGPIRLDEFVPTRLVETAVHGMDLTDALGQPPLHMPRTYQLAAEVLDEVLARRWVPGRPADLVDDDPAGTEATCGSLLSRPGDEEVPQRVPPAAGDHGEARENVPPGRRTRAPLLRSSAPVVMAPDPISWYGVTTARAGHLGRHAGRPST